MNREDRLWMKSVVAGACRAPVFEHAASLLIRAHCLAIVQVRAACCLGPSHSCVLVHGSSESFVAILFPFRFRLFEPLFPSVFVGW